MTVPVQTDFVETTMATAEDLLTDIGIPEKVVGLQITNLTRDYTIKHNVTGNERGPILAEVPFTMPTLARGTYDLKDLLITGQAGDSIRAEYQY